MKIPNNKTKAKVKELEEKVEILGNTVTGMYQEIQFMRHALGVLNEKGLFDDLDKEDGEE